MKRCFIRTTGLIITLVLLLLVVVVGSAQASEVGYGQSEVAPLSTDEAEGAEGAEDAALVCLALVGGAALLAGGVWVRRLRRMLP